MLVFPQLTTGATGQYPLVRKRWSGALTNSLADGTLVAYPDASPRLNTWEVALRDLTDAEGDAIETLFLAVEGRRGTFTLLDPVANLLAHSEELDNSCWTKDAQLQLAPGVDDPAGGTAATRVINAGQAEQSISQTLAAPAWYRYALSVYARSAGRSALSLRLSAASGSEALSFAAGPAWTRFTLSGALNATEESITLSVTVPPGASVDLYGIQAEPQPASSAYKRTGGRNGVYSHARFDDDVLRLVSEGPNQRRYDLRIVARD